jgi:hypothetical protein
MVIRSRFTESETIKGASCKELKLAAKVSAPELRRRKRQNFTGSSRPSNPAAAKVEQYVI